MCYEFIYCRTCAECYNSDYFRRCNLCNDHFKAKECGYLCEDCDDEFRKDIIFDENWYRVYLHNSCERVFQNNSISTKKSLIDRYGVFVKKKE